MELDMNENTAKRKTKVKVWNRDSVHAKHADAAARKAALLAESVDGSGEPDPNFGAKVRLQSKGFVVKTWDGKMVDAPAPRTKNGNNTPSMHPSSPDAKKVMRDFDAWELAASRKKGE
jgi:hypothetical protein